MRELFLCFVATACGGKVADEWVSPPDPSATAGVYCGPVTCAPNEACIVSATTARSCVSRGDAQAPCTDCAYAACDGPEDCAAGSSCVVSADGHGLVCVEGRLDACTDSQGHVACHTRSDCPSCFEACAASGTSVPGASDALEYGTCAHAP